MKSNNKRDNGKRNKSANRSGSTSRSNSSSNRRNKNVEYKQGISDKEDLSTISKECKVASDNDPSWYAYNKEMLANVATIPFTKIVGDKLTYDGTEQIPELTSIPGIMELQYTATYGCMNTGYTNTPENLNVKSNMTDAINVSAKNIYSFVRHANSGASNYDAPDLMITIMAADQVFACISMAIRAYGSLMLYTQNNRYMPEPLIKACGFDFQECMNNIAQFRYFINLAIAKASVIWVPSNLTLVNRHYWMNAHVYTDGNDPKSQMYLYRPSGFYKFSSTGDRKGSSLEYKACPKDGFTPLTWFRYVTDLLDPIISDEDMGIMFGDMLKAYGASSLFSLQPMPEDYVVLPVYSSEVLEQIHNTTFIPTNSGTQFGVKQKDGIIYEAPIFIPANDVSTIDFTGFIDFKDGRPSPERLMVGTRNVAIWDGSFSTTTSPDYSAATVICGTEIFNKATIYYMHDGAVLSYSAVTNNFKPTVESFLAFATLASRFDWAPRFNCCTKTQPIEGITRAKVIGSVQDIENYTTLSRDNIKDLHNVAIMSEFSVPMKV